MYGKEENEGKQGSRAKEGRRNLAPMVISKVGAYGYRKCLEVTSQNR